MHTIAPLPVELENYDPASLCRAGEPPRGCDRLPPRPLPTDALMPKTLTPAGRGAARLSPQGEMRHTLEPMDEVWQSADRMNRYLKLAGTHLRFQVTERTGRVIVWVVNIETEKLMRPIAPDSMMRFACRMSHMSSLLFESGG